jgi:archaellum component FlaC
MSSTVEEFNDPHFDPIHYVNVAARNYITNNNNKDEGENAVELERLLSELEMRLQLLGEDISLQLERESALGVKRIPTAIGEIEVLEENVESLTSTVKNISRSLDETEFPSKQSIERLRKIDEVKSRMERARDTLSEAAGLAELMHSVDSVFNGENVSNMADALVRMKRGLAIVGDVPEFADGRDRIAVLESRLESAARPALLRALEMDKGVNTSGGSATNMVSSSGSRDSIKFARDARDALRSIGKNESIEGAYAEARVVSPAMDFWVAFEEKTYNDGLMMSESSPSNVSNNNDKKTDEDATNEAFANFLPQFYDFVISLIEKEVNWTKSTFPEDVATLVSAGVASLHRAIAKKMQKRLDTLCYGSFYGDGANSNTNSSSTNNNNDGESNVDIGADLENMMRCRIATTRYATRLCGALEPCVRKMVTAAMKENASGNGEDDDASNALDESYLLSSSEDEDDDFRSRFTIDVDAVNGTNADGSNGKGDGSGAANNKKSKKREKVATAVQKFTEALSTVFIPFVKSEKVFPKLESIKLREEIVSLATSTVDADDFDGDFLAFSAAIEKTCKSASKSAMKSFISCKEYSSGLETVAAVKSIDDSLTRFMKELEGRLKAVRIAIGLDKSIGGASSSSNKNPEDFIDASLSLLRATKSVPQTFADLDARASFTLKQIANESNFANGGGSTSDVEFLRAIGGKKHMDIVFSTQSRLDAGRSRMLSSYLEPFAESSSASALSRNNSKNDKSGILAAAHSVFPRTADAAAQFRDACERLVRDCLLHRVRRELENIENDQIWTKMAAQTAHDLPTFSAYPQEKATNSGEYLLSLPTRLEALVNVVGDDVGAAASSASAGFFGNDEEDEDLASIWMERVAEASATIFLERVKSIRRLSEPGAAQLAADLEYFSNVVTALTSRPQRGLLAYMQCASVDADDYARFARETVEQQQQQQQSAENSNSSSEAFIDHRIVKQVAAMRGIAL